MRKTLAIIFLLLPAFANANPNMELANKFFPDSRVLYKNFMALKAQQTKKISHLAKKKSPKDWQQVKLPDGGDILAVRQLETNPASLYAVGVNNNVFQSTDNGKHWSLMTSFFNNPSFLPVEITVLDDKLYAYVNVLTENKAYFELYQSEDNGLHWSKIPMPSSIHNLYRFSPGSNLLAANNNLYIQGFEKNVIVAYNPRTSIASVLNLPEDIQQQPSTVKTVLQLKHTGSDLYLNTYFFDDQHSEVKSRIYRSSDAGITWQNLGLNNVAITTILKDKGVLYAAGTTNARNTKQQLMPTLYKSTDNGKTWTDTLKNADIQPGIITTLFAKDDFIYALKMTGDYKSITIYKSASNANEWQKISELKAYFIGGDLMATASNGKLFVASNQGIYTSLDDFKNWQLANEGLSVRRLNAAWTVSSGTLFISSMPLLQDAPNEIFLSKNNGDSWTKVTGIQGITTSVVDASPKIVYATTYLTQKSQFNIYKSTDGGVTWTLINANLTPTNLETVAKMIHFKTTLYVAANDGIYMIDDNANTWKQFSLYPNISSGGLRATIAIANNKIFVTYGCSNSLVSKPLSEPNATWDTVYWNDNMWCQVTDVTSNNQHDKLLLAGKSGVLASVDDGKSWKTSNTGLPKDSIGALEFRSSGPLTTINLGKLNCGPGCIQSYWYQSKNFGGSWYATKFFDAAANSHYMFSIMAPGNGKLYRHDIE